MSSNIQAAIAGAAHEFITESVSMITNVPSLIQKSLKSIENIERLCLKLSNRMSFLSNEGKTKDVDKLEEIKHLKLLVDQLFQKKLNMLTTQSYMIEQHVSYFIYFIIYTRLILMLFRQYIA